MSKLTDGLSKQEVKLINQLYWRSGDYAIAWCYSRMLGTSVAWILYPFINALYPNKEDQEKKMLALERQSKGFFNITPQMAPLCYSIFAAMEKEAAENEDFDVSSIEAVKASIQGPLSGIGDSIFWVTWRVIATGIALPFCLEGNILGPILFALLFNIPGFVLRYYLAFVGYKLGTTFISNVYKSGLIQLLTKTAAIIGLTMIGGMIAQQVSVPISLVLNFSGAEMNVVDIFNGILPGMLELGLAMLCLYLVKKRTNILILILGIFAFGILGALIGLF
mgnify:CR=1 FL=1